MTERIYFHVFLAKRAVDNQAWPRIYSSENLATTCPDRVTVVKQVDFFPKDFLNSPDAVDSHLHAEPSCEGSGASTAAGDLSPLQRLIATARALLTLDEQTAKWAYELAGQDWSDQIWLGKDPDHAKLCIQLREALEPFKRVKP